jgi:hypothetical protein
VFFPYCPVKNKVKFRLIHFSLAKIAPEKRINQIILCAAQFYAFPFSIRNNMLVETGNPTGVTVLEGTEYVAENPHSVPDGTGAGCETHHFYQYSVPDGTMAGCNLLSLCCDKVLPCRNYPDRLNLSE